MLSLQTYLIDLRYFFLIQNLINEPSCSVFKIVWPAFFAHAGRSFKAPLSVTCSYKTSSLSNVSIPFFNFTIGIGHVKPVTSIKESA